MFDFIKYPDTLAVANSGNPAKGQIAYADIVRAHDYLVVEEKADGSELGLSFNEGGICQWQHRGQLLDPRQLSKEFLPLLAWTALKEDALLAQLGTRYVLFGEWLYGKHTLYYDALPDFFVEYDLFDRETLSFLATAPRRTLLAGCEITPVPVLYEGPPPPTLEALLAYLQPSQFKSSAWREALTREATWRNLDLTRLLKETELTDESEGLYIKAESGGKTVARYKWVRPDFLATLKASGSHWQQRPFFPNKLKNA